MRETDSQRRSVIPLVAIFGTIAILAYAGISGAIDFAAAINTVSNITETLADSAGQLLSDIVRPSQPPNEQPLNP